MAAWVAKQVRIFRNAFERPATSPQLWFRIRLRPCAARTAISSLAIENPEQERDELLRVSRILGEHLLLTSPETQVIGWLERGKCDSVGTPAFNSEGSTSWVDPVAFPTVLPTG